MDSPYDDAGRREHEFGNGIPGPLDGWRLDPRLGSFKTPLRIHDLSERGCFVIALYDARPGAALDLKIALPQGRSVRVKGEVLYHSHDEFGFAVAFTDLTPHVRETLASCVPRPQGVV